MTGNISRISSGVVLAALLVTTVALNAQTERMRAAWNRPQKPFKVFGNTYWVGTYSLGSVLVTSDADMSSSMRRCRSQYLRFASTSASLVSGSRTSR
jgi:hypothetical protein